MELTENTVLVLGAGFTKAFVPSAPLLVDDYNCKQLLEKYKDFPHARRILEMELAVHGEKIDLERVMTRLYGKMPYDRERGASGELGLLLSDLQKAFVQKMVTAASEKIYSEDIATFAGLCVRNKVTCVTFNYDDIFDKELFKSNPVSEVPTMPQVLYWHPDGGYGFFCQPSKTCVGAALVDMDTTAMLLLKLHGSVNWRIRRGYEPPYSIDAIVHHEDWMPPERSGIYDRRIPPRSTIEMHLEQEFFMVPPLLTKEALINQPVLRLIWSLAFNALSKAKKVIFVGYSFHITDIASGFLFREAMSQSAEIRVINIAASDEKQAEVINVYRNVFPHITKDCFEFTDARLWAQRIVADQGTAAGGS